MVLAFLLNTILSEGREYANYLFGLMEIVKNLLPLKIV